MPFGVGVQQYFSASWKAFLDGSSFFQEPFRDPYTSKYGPALKPGPGQSSLVVVPGWDDVVKIGVPDPADPAVKAANKDLAQKITQSAEPAYVQAVGSVMTAVDNLRDLAAMMVVAGRVALWLSPRIAGGLVPFLGPLVGAFTVLQALHWLTASAIPGYALLCKTPGEAILAAVPGILWAAGLKGYVEKAGRHNPYALTHELKNAYTPGGWRTVVAQGVTTTKYIAPVLGSAFAINKGTVLMSARFTAVAFGYGVTLGAVVGFINAAVFSSARYLSGEPVTWDNSANQPTMTRALSRSPLPGTRADWVAASTASRALWSAPALLPVFDQLDDETVLRFMAGLVVALDITKRYLWGTPWLPPVEAQGAQGLPAPPVAAWWVAESLAGTPWRPSQAPTWPYPDLPAAPTLDQMVQGWETHGLPAVARWLDAHNGDAIGSFVGAVMLHVVEQTALMLTEDANSLDTHMVPEWNLLAALGASSRGVNVSDPQSRIMDFWNRALVLTASGPRKQLTANQLDQLAQAAGIRLIRIAPPPMQL